MKNNKFVGVLIVLSLVLTNGCSKKPKTHEEWAIYCVDKSDSEFSDCLKEWREWEK